MIHFKIRFDSKSKVYSRGKLYYFGEKEKHPKWKNKPKRTRIIKNEKDYERRT